MVNKKKSLDNWGRPRKQLIEGVKEVSLTVQLPETLIKALRKEGKKQGKSMKELIGTSLLSTYAELLNIPQGDNNLVELEKSNENNLNSRLKKILFKMKRIFIMLIVAMLSFSVDAQNATEITTVATALFLGYLDKATAIAESHGGGGGPGTGWGKKDDEDELAFKRRCMLMAMHMMRPQNKVKKSRWHR